jgi:hypothetical protein
VAVLFQIVIQAHLFRLLLCMFTIYNAVSDPSSFVMYNYVSLYPRSIIVSSRLEARRGSADYLHLVTLVSLANSFGTSSDDLTATLISTGSSDLVS